MLRSAGGTFLMNRLMHWLLVPALAFAIAASVRGQAAQPTAVVLENVRIIDGTGAAPIDHGRVVILGDRLAAVGPEAAVSIPPEAGRIDLSGRTVMPGLVDLHFHIETDPKMALRQLSHGVTAF